MSEKRFTTDYSDFLKNDKTFIKRGNERLTYKEIVDLLNEQQATINKQQDQISYWKHKVNSLLWILSQFDKEKVKELLKEVGE